MLETKKGKDLQGVVEKLGLPVGLEKVKPEIRGTKSEVRK